MKTRTPFFLRTFTILLSQFFQVLQFTATFETKRFYNRKFFPINSGFLGKDEKSILPTQF